MPGLLVIIALLGAAVVGLLVANVAQAARKGLMVSAGYGGSVFFATATLAIVALQAAGLLSSPS
ncbi:hypothetical protein [Streptomyces sp. NPDC057552]|uniref:hypothetical protein n=1 Tax=Streptomyces sp. NPDC057552 TaxID=3350537 RepID=UPI00368DB76C